MAISIDFIDISSNFVSKQTNYSYQGAIIRWLIAPGVAKLKINLAHGKFILKFAVIY